MGLLAKQVGKIKYLNAKEGSLRDGEHEYGGYAGVITGIRTRESRFANQPPTIQIQFRMEDPEMQNVEPVVISGTMIAGNGMVTVFARMLIARLVKKGNTGPGEPIEISVYPGGDTKATCVAVRRRGEDAPMRGVNLRKEDAVECRKLTERAVEYLISLYGTFGRDVEEVRPQTSVTEDEFESREPDEAPQAASAPDAQQPPAATSPDPEGWKVFDKEDDDDLPF